MVSVIGTVEGGAFCVCDLEASHRWIFSLPIHVVHYRLVVAMVLARAQERQSGLACFPMSTW